MAASTNTTTEIITRGLVQLPPDSERVTDVDEEVYTLYPMNSPSAHSPWSTRFSYSILIYKQVLVSNLGHFVAWVTLIPTRILWL